MILGFCVIKISCRSVRWKKEKHMTSQIDLRLEGTFVTAL